MYNTYSPPLYRVKKRTKNGIFAYHYAKTPQKVGKKVIFFEVRLRWMVIVISSTTQDKYH